jgi:Ca-activated chloride channel family protein
MKRAVILFALLALAAADAAQKNPFEHGIKLYEQGRYADAVREFSRAEKIDPKDILAKYNGLTSLAAAGDLQRALAKLGADFEALDVHPSVRARAAYNLGTAFLGLADEADRAGQLQTRAGELTESAKWLRRSLLDSPGDNQVRNNLEYANKLLDKLRQQQQQQQKQQQNGEGKDQKDQQQQQNQSDQNRQQQNEQQQQQNKQQEGQQQNEQQQRERQGTQQEQQQQQKPREIPPDVARNLLKAARDAELKALKMLRDQQNKDAKKQPGNRKDW